MRSYLPTLRSLFVAGSVTVAAALCPIDVTVDFDGPLMVPPLASTLLLASSSTLLAAAGCLLRQHRGGPPVAAPAPWA